MGTDLEIVKEIFGSQQLREMEHHPAHAAGAFCLSGFEKSLIISYDGGGDDLDGLNFFTVFLADRSVNNGCPERLMRLPLDLGTGYGMIGVAIKEIRKPIPMGLAQLTLAGKLMGLAAYGEVRKEWINPFKEYFLLSRNHRDEYFEINFALFQVLMHKPGLVGNYNTVEGQVAWDLAATSQFVFEEVVLEKILGIIQEHRLPVCLTGGCALNVLFNQRLRDAIDLPIYVPPNPNDCGLSFGMLVLDQPPSHPVEITYKGFPILDTHVVDQFTDTHPTQEVTTTEVAQLLAEGKIIGLVQGGSEAGPRALGNRSILCDPSYPDMKDILNRKVKFREWFRPFAPVVRAHEVSSYFHFEGETPYMSFAPRVRAEWKHRIPAIVHEDGTARVQTVTASQNKYLYELITEFEQTKGIGVLLNTSFNIKGKPILTTVEDALEVLDTTELDYVLFRDGERSLLFSSRHSDAHLEEDTARVTATETAQTARKSNV